MFFTLWGKKNIPYVLLGIIRAWLLQNPISGVLIIYWMLLSRKSDLRDKIKKFQLLSASMQGS